VSLSSHSTSIELAQQVAHQLAGVYENQAQAAQDPVWYVHLRAWWRLVPSFADKSFMNDREMGSVTLFAEQAAVINLDRPYRQRLVRLIPKETGVIAQFYQFKTIEPFIGAGASPEKLATLQETDVIELPHCVLDIGVLETTAGGSRCYSAKPRSDDRCQFSYPDGQGGSKTGQVELGFEVGPGYFHSYDKGIDPVNGRVLWGAMMGPYRYDKIENV
jgi:CpeT/CpcT family (DUF1001)